MQIINLFCTLCIAMTGIFVLVQARRAAAKAFAWAVGFAALHAGVGWIGQTFSVLFFRIAQTPLWEKVVFGPFILLFLFFATIKIFQAVIARIYGGNVAAQLTASALAQTFRVIGRAIRFIFLLPAYLFKRRERLDDMLRDWRRG